MCVNTFTIICMFKSGRVGFRVLSSCSSNSLERPHVMIRTCEPHRRPVYALDTLSQSKKTILRGASSHMLKHGRQARVPNENYATHQLHPMLMMTEASPLVPPAGGHPPRRCDTPHHCANLKQQQHRRLQEDMGRGTRGVSRIRPKHRECSCRACTVC
jgi:hypothetical protein